MTGTLVRLTRPSGQIVEFEVDDDHTIPAAVTELLRRERLEKEMEALRG